MNTENAMYARGAESSSRDICFEERCHNGKVSKVERYGWKVKDAPGQLVYIDKNQMCVDHTYQRNLVEAKVRELSREWSWMACNVITVAERDGEYFIVEGQHRHAAALRRSDITELPCIVFQSDSVQSEAEGFLLANGNRKPVSSVGKFKAQIVSGNETAVYIDKVLRRYGMKIVEGQAKKPLQLKSVNSCYRMAKQSKESFEKVMGLVAELCEDAPIKERLVAGLFYMQTNGLDVTDKALRKRILAVGEARLLDGANRAAAFFTSGGAKVWAQGMLEEINRKLRNKYELRGHE
jgi:hypothetical protein